MKRFSDQFPTFFDWENQSRDTQYTKRTTRLHYRYPNATLPQLTGREKLSSTKLPLHIVDPRGLKPKERNLRNKSLSILNRVRRGEKYPDVIEKSNISENILEKYLGNYIKIKDDSVKVTKSDKIPREMIISEDGLDIPIIVKNSRDASIIGQYHNAKRYFIQTGDSSKLKEFKKIRLRDVDGKSHQLETNPDKIIEIEDRKEEPEAFEIYKT